MSTTTRSAGVGAVGSQSRSTGISARPDPTTGVRRWACALAFPLAFLGQVFGCLGYALATMHGGDDATGANALRLYADNPGLVQMAVVGSILGSMLFVPGALAAVRLLRSTKPRLSLIGGILAIAGYLSYLTVLGSDFVTLTLGQGHIDAGAALDAAQALPASVWLFPVFVVGNLLGVALLAVAVMLSRGSVLGRRGSWVAGIGILCWPVLHITGLIVGTEWFEVAGATLATTGAALVAVAAIRLGNREWARRG